MSYDKLDGSMAGDEGFDPLGLSNINEVGIDLYWLREAELKHCRVAMLAVVGLLAQEAGLSFPGYVSYIVLVLVIDMLVYCGDGIRTPPLTLHTDSHHLPYLLYYVLYCVHLSFSLPARTKSNYSGKSSMNIPVKSPVHSSSLALSNVRTIYTCNTLYTTYYQNSYRIVSNLV